MHKALFLDLYDALADRAARNVIDAYMTAYFNAWIDNQNLFAPEKRWVTAFAPRVADSPRKLARFAELYPGRTARVGGPPPRQLVRLRTPVVA